ncbi:transposase IS4 family protein [Thioalkalivibrio nitratireducens DSM 14787]|uniref:Transposase IS4 family protein n=1 Tax=Thioalkalivibrio nitratireducens (strain DSM 14787 / UNIQEM 213 / ALEN2) TaxID=1255043 RepID=L0DVY1_THIND|nr:transposase [Thioalkalivibrio nitratireducens]AGA33135.1 transposase IS4 family protein [Thioalkalivibrio nitratireducens DSM 14787]
MPSTTAGSPTGGRLFEVARATASRGSVELQVDGQSLRTKTSKRPARLGRAARTAELELRYTPVTLRGTPAGADPPVTLELTVVHALERDPPKGEKPLEWFVLTTLTVTSAEQAAEILRWYRLRWRIEDWHRVLKSGCKIDELGHHSVERLGTRHRDPAGHRLAGDADDPAGPRGPGTAAGAAVLGRRTAGAR